MGSVLSSRAAEDENWKSDARYAMESGTFCVICGAPFDIEGDVYNLNPKDPRYQWLFGVRLLGYKQDVNNHRLGSGEAEPINTSDIEDIFLSEKVWFSLAGSGTFQVFDQTREGDIWYDSLWYGRTAYGHVGGTLFPLHEACITIACRAIDHARVEQKVLKTRHSLEILCQLLNMRFLARHTYASPEDPMVNDIFDLCGCSDQYGPRSVLALTRLGWWGGEYDTFYTDPIDVSELESFVFDVLLASARTEDTDVHPLVTTREPQGIERLPAELLDVICEYLPAQSVIKLHRTSKALTVALPLDNAFWRDSLRSGSLHPHIWDLDTKGIETLREESGVTFSTAGWDWRTVAKLLAMKQFPVTGADPRLTDMPLGLRNRCRIWSVIENALRTDADEVILLRRNDSALHID